MPQKLYEIWLNETTWIVVEFLSVDGQIVSFVVRLMLHCAAEHRCVARYDTAHGCPHLDIVDREGRLLEKKWLLGMSFDEGLRFAIVDFKSNHEH